MTGPGRRTRRPAAALALLAVAGVGCSHRQPAPAPAPEPEAVVAPPSRAPRPPAALAGTYDLQAVIQGRIIPGPPPPPQDPPRRGRARVVVVPVPSVLQLTARQSAAPGRAAGPGRQLGAAVSLPGYSLPPRGRTTQVALWWPAAPDSVLVRWVVRQRNAAVSLRGTQRGDTLSGDVWYTMLETGNEFQLGTFTAVRQPVRRRGR